MSEVVKKRGFGMRLMTWRAPIIISYHKRMRGAGVRGIDNITESGAVECNERDHADGSLRTSNRPISERDLWDTLRVNAHTYEQRSSSFNFGRVLVLNTPPASIFVSYVDVVG